MRSRAQNLLRSRGDAFSYSRAHLGVATEDDQCLLQGRVQDGTISVQSRIGDITVRLVFTPGYRLQSGSLSVHSRAGDSIMISVVSRVGCRAFYQTSRAWGAQVFPKGKMS